MRLQHGSSDLPRFAAALTPKPRRLRLESGRRGPSRGAVDPPSGHRLVDFGAYWPHSAVSPSSVRPSVARVSSRAKSIRNWSPSGMPRRQLIVLGTVREISWSHRRRDSVPSSWPSLCRHWRPWVKRVSPSRRPDWPLIPRAPARRARDGRRGRSAGPVALDTRVARARRRELSRLRFRRSSIVVSIARARRATQRGDRCSPRPRARRRRGVSPGGHGTARYHHRGHGAVCHGGLRRESVAPDDDAALYGQDYQLDLQ